ncbi:hypothetical protein SMACR_00916 [Sordaria macrospora]|uniref:Uncharacterized protein n=1 Tax=Sordaria macrospora TaxID=5147 RepID=A0A8S8ZUR3_SORMA|nr:hypothetical protein SMACR_00916 [Sordaria macrospora]WPJ62160.1 hypothetical protein SMAC4_00916 [Sordaria macrospora]
MRPRPWAAVLEFPTPSTSGRLRVVGMLSPPTGRRTRLPSVASSSSSLPQSGSLALRRSTVTRCPSLVASIPADTGADRLSSTSGRKRKMGRRRRRSRFGKHTFLPRRPSVKQYIWLPKGFDGITGHLGLGEAGRWR